MSFPPTPPYGPSMVASFFAKRISLPDGQSDMFTLINHFQTIFDHMPMKVVLTEVIDERTFNYVPLHHISHEFEQFDLEGKILEDIFPVSALQQMKQLYQKCFSSPSLIEHEIELRNAEGEAYQWILCFIVPLFNEQESLTHMMLIAYDITLRKQRELCEQQEKIAQLKHLSNDLLERSIPVLALTAYSVLMPVLGPLDTTREVLIQARLQELAADQAIKYVVVDLTGIASSDSRLPTLLATLASAAATLPFRLIITGLGQAQTVQLKELTLLPDGVLLCNDLQAALQIVKQ